MIEWHSYCSFESFKSKLLEYIYNVLLPDECILLFYNMEMCIPRLTEYVKCELDMQVGADFKFHW